MGDIVKGMSIEEQYLNDRINGMDYSLENKIKEVGFDSLEDYFDAKRLYKIQNCNIKLTTCDVENTVSVAWDLALKQQPSLLVVSSDKKFVYHGNEELNRNYCQENNIPIYEVGHFGGSIVGDAGDVSIDIIVPLDIDINSEWVLKKMLSIFNKYHYNATIDNNDILIDNKKVLGSASIATDNMFAFISHISFTDHSGYIQNICEINANKEPGFITPPLTREILINEVKLWLMVQ